jgi:tetrahydrodipicolinate N-succinyltransferase
MAISVTRTRSARVYHTEQVHYLYQRFNYNDVAVDATQPGKFYLGVLPANCMPMETYVRVNAAFTGANLIAGTSSAGSSAALVSTADVAGTTGLYVVDRYMGTYSTAPVSLYIQTKTTGETVGQADVWQAYLPAHNAT